MIPRYFKNLSGSAFRVFHRSGQREIPVSLLRVLGPPGDMTLEVPTSFLGAQRPNGAALAAQRFPC